MHTHAVVCCMRQRPRVGDFVKHLVGVRQVGIHVHMSVSCREEEEGLMQPAMPTSWLTHRLLFHGHLDPR
jgi:hypothetical protein